MDNMTWKMNTNRNTIAVIASYNPDLPRFQKVLQHVRKQVERVIVVDNGSSNIGEIEELSNDIDVLVIRNNRNMGLAFALNQGIQVAQNFSPEFILTLDQDTIVYENAMSFLFDAVEKLRLKEYGLIALSPGGHTKGFVRERLVWTSGSIIKVDVFKLGVRYRNDFFIDQVDFDFCNKLRKKSIKIFRFDYKLMDHRLGKSVLLRGKVSNYESSWRFYYIVRNSTVLLKEKALDLRYYIAQISSSFYPLLQIEGVKKSSKSLILGLCDGIFSRLGYRAPD